MRVSQSRYASVASGRSCCARASASRSAAVSGLSRSKSTSSIFFDDIEDSQQSGTFKVVPHHAAVNVWQRQQVFDVRNVNGHAPRRVFDGLDLHRNQMLWFRHRKLARTSDDALMGIREDTVCGVAV